jgi:hypothetical protein
VLDIPEGFDATWDMPNQTALVSFLDGTYDEGLGEVSFLGTTGPEANTTAYMNKLGEGSSCMTAYTAYTQAIDDDYWPATVPARLDALYCRHPTLDTVADDYAVQREGSNGTDDFKLLTFRARELGFLEVNWSKKGFAELQFSRNVALDRQFYYADDDFDADDITLVEVAHLPDGEPTNGIRAEWDLILDNPADRFHAEYTLTETIATIDYYNGVHKFTNESATMRKIVLQDVPDSVVLEWVFNPRNGSVDFTASNLWEVGLLDQSDGERYVAWLALQSLHFDYDLALPGEESCEVPGVWVVVEFCYRIFRLDTTLDAVDADLDGLLGIYSLTDSLDNLDSGEAPDGKEFIPDWAFMMDDFDLLEVHILWDVGVALDGAFLIGLPAITFALFPTINIVLNVGTIIADFFWNDQVDEDLGTFPLPIGIPGSCPTGIWTVDIDINTVKDYVDQNPVHLFPDTGESLLDDMSTFTLIPFLPIDLCASPDIIDVHIKLDVPGFHRFPDHPTLFP